jgi:hypothetical protein
MHETALRLFPDSSYAKEHSTGAPTKPAKKLARSRRRLGRRRVKPAPDDAIVIRPEEKKAA